VVTGILALGFLTLRLAYAGKPVFVVPHANHIEVTGPVVVFLFAILMWISTLLLLPAVAVGRIAARGGSRRDGDIAMAIFASYVIGQFMPLFY
jgi:hypothetical protein